MDTLRLILKLFMPGGIGSRFILLYNDKNIKDNVFASVYPSTLSRADVCCHIKLLTIKKNKKRDE